MVKLFNAYHFMFISIVVLLALLIFFIIRKKSNKTIFIVLLCILFFSFLTNICKPFFEPYKSNWPESIRFILPTTICGTNTWIFPFIFLSKNKTLKDYMFYIGIISGVAAVVYPLDAVGRMAGSFDAIRFFISHGSLCVVPFLMVLLKLHKLSYKRAWKPALIFFCVLTVILLTEVLLAAMGFTRLDLLFDSSYRNGAFIFGPQKDLPFVGKAFLALTPDVFTKVAFGVNKGAVLYWPVIWLVVPAFVYIGALCFVISMAFDYKQFAIDLKTFWRKLRFKQKN